MLKHSEMSKHCAASRRVLRNVALALATLPVLTAIGGAAFAGSPTPPAAAVPVRFAIVGDFGSADERQEAIGAQIAAQHDRAAIDLIVTTGDNIYPDGAPSRFVKAFEQPFAPIIERQIPVYAALGNHDVRAGREAQMNYPLFNMQGRRYYTLSAGGSTAEFFVLDSTDLDDEQLRWLDRALGESRAVWKIAVFHHPLYSSAGHGASSEQRGRLEPILERHRVSVVLSGHDHVYQRVTLQRGIQYFVTGAAGKVRKGDLDPRDGLVAAGYDRDCHFMVFESDGTSLRFKAITARGEVVDEGSIGRPAPAAE